MIEAAFQHRSGRVIAFGRAALALFFLTAIWLDRSQPMLAAPETYGLLALYVLASAALLALTWDNWWLEAKLAGPAHVVDMLVFLWLNYATQGYTSPFFTFFAFLIFSASIRWGWRGTAATAAIIVILYIASAVTAASWGTQAFEWRRFVLRGSYLVALSALIILWLVATRASAAPAPDLPGMEQGRDRPDMAPLLALAAARFRAPRALCVWSEREEPWTWVSVLEPAGFDEVRLDPGRFDPPISPDAGERPFLFDQQPGRTLARAGPRRRVARLLRDPVHQALAREHGALRGLRIPIRSESVSGELLVIDVPGLCSDDLDIAEETAAQIAALLEHAKLFHATEEAAGMRARLSLARDLHDSVVQFLAGLAFRLEGVRKSAAAGRDVARDIDALQAELGREQQDLRRFIAELRAAPAGLSGERAELAGSLRELTGRIGAQWSVACSLVATPQRIDVPPPLERNVRQLVREAVANAVRHGAATEVETRLRRCDDALELVISDNGAGFAVAGDFDDEELARHGPSSVRERVRNLGGRLRLASSPAGSRLSITLPIREAP
ncbi:MAG TPA: ATP-binding protein [Allosphingosinicella sp.]|nr:ATP-binding protein [Allosphingosinicella sp.]